MRNDSEIIVRHDGAGLATRAVQDAIDSAAKAGGGRVVVPAGRYTIGTIRLRSDVHLVIAPGAVIAASANLDDYHEESEGHLPPEFPYVKCLFVGFDLQNVEISGGGTVDSSGARFMDYSSPEFDETFTREALAAMPEERRHEYVSVHAAPRPTWIFFLRRCRGVRFHDFRIVDAARWTTRFSCCENVIMSGLIIENDLRAANSDGMHFTSCRSVVVSDCTITAGDDCIAVTTYGDTEPSSGTVISNCVLTSHSSGIRIGYGDGAVLEDVAVTNCVFRACNRGVGIFAGAGSTVRGITLSSLRMTTRLIAGTWWGKAEPLFVGTLGARATIEDVVVDELSARSEQGIVLNACPGSRVRSVELRGVRLEILSGAMTPFAGGTLDLRPLSIERRALPAIYARAVERLRLADVAVAAAPDAGVTGPIELDGCRSVEIGRLVG